MSACNLALSPCTAMMPSLRPRPETAKPCITERHFLDILQNLETSPLRCFTDVFTVYSKSESGRQSLSASSSTPKPDRSHRNTRSSVHPKSHKPAVFRLKRKPKCKTKNVILSPSHRKSPDALKSAKSSPRYPHTLKSSRQSASAELSVTPRHRHNGATQPTCHVLSLLETICGHDRSVSCEQLSLIPRWIGRYGVSLGNAEVRQVLGTCNSLQASIVCYNILKRSLLRRCSNIHNVISSISFDEIHELLEQLGNFYLRFVTDGSCLVSLMNVIFALDYISRFLDLFAFHKSHHSLSHDWFRSSFQHRLLKLASSIHHDVSRFSAQNSFVLDSLPKICDILRKLLALSMRNDSKRDANVIKIAVQYTHAARLSERRLLVESLKQSSVRLQVSQLVLERHCLLSLQRRPVSSPSLGDILDCFTGDVIVSTVMLSTIDEEASDDEGVAGAHNPAELCEELCWLLEVSVQSYLSAVQENAKKKKQNVSDNDVRHWTKSLSHSDLTALLQLPVYAQRLREMLQKCVNTDIVNTKTSLILYRLECLADLCEIHN